MPRTVIQTSQHSLVRAKQSIRKFLAATESLPPLSSADKLPVKESTVAHPISIVDVEWRLKAVKSNKAPGPNLLRNWILNNFSMEVS